MATETTTPTAAEPTIGQLVASASRDISTLVSKEIELAKSELKVSAIKGGLGAALLIVAGFILLLSLIILSITIAFFINWEGHGLSLMWSFLIVFGGYVVIAGLLGFIGVKKLMKVRGPQKAIAQAQQIPGALKRG
ncbi:hypothetical protein Back2_19790 [Nocardioides baekrokdamisoli]|uniref:Transporter n=1 Tax=Nocardioides baekrokdamisoli TaxID=1804624 RepID=A0A3G9IHM0_9ACTN|nr:phage holin family protein [Nocardioides baekrokdamisoli]BBH17692.1 hypothetical protein Back2_19790 [Nocardioides baekrokdamisoli]